MPFKYPTPEIRSDLQKSGVFARGLFKIRIFSERWVIPISDIGTRVNEEILQEWAEKLPGCRIFLENFFLSCRGYSPEVNYLNYVRDLKLYSPTNRHIRENFIYLVAAFHEITEVSEVELIERFGGRL